MQSAVTSKTKYLIAGANVGATKTEKAKALGTEVIDEALEFAFEALTEGTMCESAELDVIKVSPRSVCFECGEEFDHDRFHRICPACGSYETQLLQGRELSIESIEVEFPD